MSLTDILWIYLIANPPQIISSSTSHPHFLILFLGTSELDVYIALLVPSYPIFFIFFSLGFCLSIIANLILHIAFLVKDISVLPKNPNHHGSRYVMAILNSFTLRKG